MSFVEPSSGLKDAVFEKLVVVNINIHSLHTSSDGQFSKSELGEKCIFGEKYFNNSMLMFNLFMRNLNQNC